MTKNAPPKSLDRARQAMEPVLAAGSASLAPELRRIVEYHWGWVDARGNKAALRSGKSLRPTLALLAAEAVGSDASVAIRGAAATEMVHDFTLLHDDVMDDDEERRGRPTAWKVFGIGPAICAGDALVLLAQQVVLGDPSVHREAAASELLSATQAVLAGQALDLAFEGRTDVSVEDYLEMSGGKTGALLGGASAIGAILAGGSPSQVDRLREFGFRLGLAFQAVDDWLGIWGDPDRVGKPSASDLRQRKSSLPIVMGMAAGAPESQTLREWIESDAAEDEDAIEACVRCLDALGIERATIEVAERELARALAILDTESFDAAARDELGTLARFVVEREF